MRIKEKSPFKPKFLGPISCFWLCETFDVPGLLLYGVISVLYPLQLIFRVP